MKEEMNETMKNETIEILNNIENNKIPGFDSVNNRTVKNTIVNKITVLLIHNLYLSILNGVVPDKMEIAKRRRTRVY